MDATTPLPTGTVTFLFTDIEGSTRLLHSLGERFTALLEEHHRLLRDAFQPRGAHEVRTMGDAFFVVFRHAADAVAAAVAAQRAVAAHPWPPRAPIRVRMALHTGEATIGGDDYVGLEVHRAARISAAGHGGQILLSQRTRDLLAQELPVGVSLRDMGAHCLKDLLHPEHLFQVVIDGLPADFPPVKSLSAHPNNLPRQLTSFIGRERELAEVTHLLAQTPLLTLTGTGGTGKTRLALQLAAERLEASADGVWFVELAALAEGALVPQEVASAFHLREEPGRSLTETLIGYLEGKQLLLVLDNCEHLVDAAARLVEALLRRCPELTVLATSREPLGIAGELTWRVPSLPVPDPQRLPGGEAERLAMVAQYEGVRLFIDRAFLHQPRFAVTAANALAVAAVCHRLDGIPLAIELAAARVKGLPVEQIAARLDDRFKLLTGGSRTALPRHQTLRGAIDWSYDLLSEPERALLRRLAVFSGGWTLAAAEAVVTDDGVEPWQVLDRVTSLVEKSLVQYEEAEGAGRHRLLETIRQYGAEQLQRSGEEALWRKRHRDWCLALAEAAEPELTGPRQGEWLSRLEEEHENLRAALDWSSERSEAEAGLRLGGALSRFWNVRGHFKEGRERLAALLALAVGGAPSSGDRARQMVRAKALNAAGNLAKQQGDYRAARALYEESLAIKRELGGQLGIASSLNNLGNVAREQGDYGAARGRYEESLAIKRELGDLQGIAYSLCNLGSVAWEQGDYGAARALCEESLAICRQLGDQCGIASLLNNLGNVAWEQGDYGATRALCEESLAICRQLGDQDGIAKSLMNLGVLAQALGDYEVARALYEESLAIRRELGDQPGIALSLCNLGSMASEQGDYGATRARFEESLAICRQLGEQWGIAYNLEGLAALAGAQGQPERAACLFGAAEALREAIGAPVSPSERAHYDRHVAAVRTALGEEAFAAAWAAGCAMSLEDAIAFALDESHEG